MPADDDGASDPFATINYYGCEAKTEVIDDTLNPVIFYLKLYHYKNRAYINIFFFFFRFGMKDIK